MDESWARGLSLVLFAYFLGSVPFGILVARLFDRTINLREIGSGNIGATNVARAAGKGAGILTLLLDAGKGIFVMTLAQMLALGRVDLWLALAGAAVFLGHVFSIYLHFKGGKGVATALGVVLFLSPVTAFILAVLFGIVVYLTRYVSLGSLCAAAALPVLMALLASSRHSVTLSLLMTFLLVYTHRENIRRLFSGEEHKLGTPKTPPADAPQG
ncbi:MAG: glycerol-3-phosphate 1-O-acyltransferase PlsY [Deltaproteobacteria bacterium]|nr:glycerol-3-phosphate 1-O-acyltransferase PlsY [Deltaproteobacteria bacterium]